MLCRNGRNPIKGIDKSFNFLGVHSVTIVEMEETRLRVLTHNVFIIIIWNNIVVEMEETRLRVLTHDILLPPYLF